MTDTVVCPCCGPSAAEQHPRVSKVIRCSNCKEWLTLNGKAFRSPYESLDAHVINVKALYCEDGCGLVDTSGYGDDVDASKELALRGWSVRPHSMGGLTSLCKDCTARYDMEHEDD